MVMQGTDIATDLTEVKSDDFADAASDGRKGSCGTV